MRDRSGQRLGNYQLIHLLGRGGFAEVYLAEHIYLKTLVAVKVLQADLAQDEFTGFLQEAQIIARLKHAHIVPIFDFGIDGTPYLVMEYLPNGSLRQRHPRGTKVPIVTIASYVNQIATALQHAHDNKVIHRDVKPENILVKSTNEIVLSDFGIAATAHRTSSLKTVHTSGTPAYMAPEHITGRPRPASDQYALGIVVYEWICGAPPFTGEPMAIMYQQTYAEVPPLDISSFSQENWEDRFLGKSVEPIVRRALSKDPQDRFESIQAFASAFSTTTFTELVEMQLLFRNLSELRTGAIEAKDATKLSTDFHALRPFKDSETLLERLRILGKTSQIAAQIYQDASNGLEAMWKQVKDDEKNEKSRLTQAKDSPPQGRDA